jgi:hypothetical protein
MLFIYIEDRTPTNILNYNLLYKLTISKMTNRNYIIAKILYGAAPQNPPIIAPMSAPIIMPEGHLQHAM